MVLGCRNNHLIYYALLRNTTHKYVITCIILHLVKEVQGFWYLLIKLKLSITKSSIIHQKKHLDGFK